MVRQEETTGGKIRRYYRSTGFGQEALREAQSKIKEDTERDRYLSAIEAKEYGIIDEVIVRKVPDETSK